MSNAMHVAKTGLNAQNSRMQAISNNLANVNTTGFKKDRVNFESLLYQVLKTSGAQTSGETNNVSGFNVGTGIGYSVLDIINSFENINNLKLKYSFKDRRDGDIEEIYSDVIKSKKILKWESKRSLDDMMSSSWKWQKNLVKF